MQLGSAAAVRRFGAALLALAAVSSTAFAWSQPALAAFACPPCLGFEEAGPRLYVEPRMPPEQRRVVRDANDRGRERVASFYGRLVSEPIVLACASPGCADRIGSGGSRGAAYATFGLRLSPSGLDEVIVAHERSHVEAHRRIGILRWAEGALPAWFDEGLAVLVSNDRRYLREKNAADRCLREPGENLPSRQREWLDAASARPDVYAEAACRVVRWVDRHGDRRAVLALLDRVGRGEPFETAWAEGGSR